MELTTTRKETNTLSTYSEKVIDVPKSYSRGKALGLVNEQSEIVGGQLKAIPHEEDRKMLYLLFMKIGATSELPSNNQLKDQMLNDFWVTLYLKNNLVPGNIPYNIIIELFTLDMVQGTIERKGNNQAAICKAFNEWVVRQDVRERLINERDLRFPDRKPIQIAESSSKPVSLSDYSLEELKTKIQKLKTFKGLKSVDLMIEEMESEIQSRK